MGIHFFHINYLIMDIVHFLMVNDNFYLKILGFVTFMYKDIN